MMASMITKWIILSILSISMNPHILILAQQQVPCFFIFGDSQNDNGNNNALTTTAKANYQPYGIDYPGAVPTGRFTNGKNMADFLAEMLGFPGSIPPFATTTTGSVRKGVNYASGAAGILDESGSRLGDRFSMREQLQNHRTTIIRLRAFLGSRRATDEYLQQCLYTVNIGSNDYINNYYQQPPSPLTSLLTPTTFADILITKFYQQLLTLYSLGSRKVAVYGVGLIGCIPQELALYPITNGSPCVDSINIAVNIFNTKLVELINYFNTALPNAQFTYINVTSISLGDPALIDVKVLNRPCCEVGANGQCAVNGGVCSDRDEFLFFDRFHPTQISMNVSASRSYKALLPTDASPLDIQRLVQQSN